MHLSRRSFLAASAATTLVSLCSSAFADEANVAAPQSATAGVDFSYDILSAQMQQLATQDYRAPQEVNEAYLKDLTYDAYRLIRFNPEKARLADIDRSAFRLHAFHMGWLFKTPVALYDVADGKAMPVSFSTDDFIYERQARELVPEHVTLPGIAGFRLHHPLNRPDIFDELIAFQGASYFRALGKGSVYGLSARGLAINTGSSEPEEFPVFTRFYVERPKSAEQQITVFAALESKSVTGAYRFVIQPGENTVIETTARLFLRDDIPQLGIAPLTSMFLFAERNRDKFDDYRPNVHDSDGLEIVKQNGERVWRPLSNPPQLASSYFAEQAPKSFALLQRDRDFDHFQDVSALYERRPSLRIEPMGDWGNGAVRLVEIPSDLEVNDNIVAFWVPKEGGKAGQSYEYAYRMHWGDLPACAEEGLAYVLESRSGAGGVSGVENADGSRKFVIDFKDGLLANLPAGEVENLTINSNIMNGEIKTQTLTPIAGEKVWRLVMDVSAPKGSIVEMTAHLSGFGRRLTETWAYQWINQ
ncbi:glucan biosynthesis protein G [uncultured Cohaesibacter sp.]|uniref:glucan biosynthesis protein n=1 Tax=uncultured Cohaesibacter sp. TaxID=1002546 RepID=UPI0029C91C25|nr:glucan biosynthesis protein G [uncultured Cohaesibacter sp.]